MSGKGFDEVYNLKGGIKAWEGQQISGPVETGIAFIRGDETIEDIFAIAYGMEEGLKGFYTSLSGRSFKADVLDNINKLAEILESFKILSNA